MRNVLAVGLSLLALTITGCTSNTATPMPSVAVPTSRPTTAAASFEQTPLATPTATFSPIPTSSLSAAASPTPQASSDASVTDVTLTDGGQQIPAYLVAPSSAAPGSAAGIVWFHWLETGDPTSNRTEFLAEAQALADRGVVSVLVDGQFPWHDTPTSASHDVAAVQDDAQMLKQAVTVLKSQPSVDKSRVALVGHDFGAMYSSVVFGEDPSIAALVMMAPTARWADWFLPYWPHTDDPDSYTARMKPLDPVTVLKKADGRPVLLQFATEDQYVATATADEIDAAAGNGVERKDYDTGHHLNDAARADRDAWLAQILGLGPSPS